MHLHRNNLLQSCLNSCLFKHERNKLQQHIQYMGNYFQISRQFVSGRSTSNLKWNSSQNYEKCDRICNAIFLHEVTCAALKYLSILDDFRSAKPSTWGRASWMKSSQSVYFLRNGHPLLFKRKLQNIYPHRGFPAILLPWRNPQWKTLQPPGLVL